MAFKPLKLMVCIIFNLLNTGKEKFLKTSHNCGTLQNQDLDLEKDTPLLMGWCTGILKLVQTFPPRPTTNQYFTPN